MARTFFPRSTGARGPGNAAFLVQHRDETVGVVLVRDVGDGWRGWRLDYVTPRFRDFSPGEIRHRRSGLFLDRGFRRVRDADGHGCAVLRGPRFHSGRDAEGPGLRAGPDGARRRAGARKRLGRRGRRRAGVVRYGELGGDVDAVGDVVLRPPRAPAAYPTRNVVSGAAGRSTLWAASRARSRIGSISTSRSSPRASQSCSAQLDKLIVPPRVSSQGSGSAERLARCHSPAWFQDLPRSRPSSSVLRRVAWPRRSTCPREPIASVRACTPYAAARCWRRPSPST